jgi:ribosomal protein L4
MPAPKAPLLDAAGKKAKDVSLEESVFGAEIKPHLVHETVRAELNADRAGTRGAKTRAVARSHGARKAPAARAPARSARRSSPAAESPSL